MTNLRFRLVGIAFGIIAIDALLLALVRTPSVFAQAQGSDNAGIQLKKNLPGDSLNIASTDKESDQKLPSDSASEDFVESQDDSIENEAIVEKDLIGEEESGSDTGSEEAKFFFKAVRFSGNQTISTDELIKPFIPLIGTETTFEQIKLAASQSELEYKKLGYITSRVIIPVQDILSGNLTVRVVEGFLEDLQVRGATEGLQKYVRKQLVPVIDSQSQAIFNYKTLERQLLQIKEFGALSFTSTLVKGNSLGGSIIIVDIKQSSVSGAIGLNNNVSDALGNIKASAGVQYVLPISQPLKISAGTSYAFPYTNGLFTGYTFLSSPIGNEGFVANALWSTSSTSSKDLYDGAGDLQTKGSSDYWSFGISYPIILERNKKLAVELSGDGQDNVNDLYLDDRKASNVSADKVRALRLTVSGYYSGTTFINSGSVRISQGIDGLNNDLGSSKFKSNAFSDPAFTSVLVNAGRTQKLFNTNLLISSKFSGQYSFNALPSSEGFNYGGPSFGRAFNSVYIMGDQGFSGSLELSHPFDVSVFNSNAYVSPFVWYDRGYTYYKEGPLKDQSASTFGLGVRGNASNVDFELGLGLPMSNTLDSNHVGLSDAIVYFNSGWRF